MITNNAIVISFTGAYRHVFSAMKNCSEAMETVSVHEEKLSSLGLLSFETKAIVLHLEQTLLKLGSHHQLTRGVFYCLIVPTDIPGQSFIR